MRTNNFTKSMSQKSNAELEKILEKKDHYINEAIQAVIWELEDRNIIEKSEVSVDVDLCDNNLKEEIISKDYIGDERPSEELIPPTLYSKKAILGFTIFFSTIFGAVLLMYNLKERNKYKARTQVLVFAVLYTILSAVVLNFFPEMMSITLIFNLVGYAILTEFFWNKNLSEDIEYRKKEIWKPLAISIVILFVLVLISFLPQPALD